MKGRPPLVSTCSMLSSVSQFEKPVLWSCAGVWDGEWLADTQLSEGGGPNPAHEQVRVPQAALRTGAPGVFDLLTNVKRKA
jgi:hypothetical protein